MWNKSSRCLSRTDTLGSQCIRSQREMKVFTFRNMLYVFVPCAALWSLSTRPISCTISCHDGGGPTRKHVVQLILLTPQLAADVQGMHQMRGSEVRMFVSSSEVCSSAVCVVVSSEVSEVCVSPQNDAIRNDLSMRTQSPVSAKNLPLSNGIFLAVIDNRLSNCPSHAAAELE